MKKFVFVFFILLLVYPALAAGQVSKRPNEIKSMYEIGQYQEIIDEYASKPRTLSAEELAYTALSYIRLDDLKNALTYANQAVQKDTKNAYGYYAEGVINSIENNYIEAISNFDIAIGLSPKQSDFYTELGDVYFAQGNFQKALDNYHLAIRQPNPNEKAFYMIAATYANQDNIKNALDTFYVAKSKIRKDGELLVTALYNIAKIEYDNKNYKKASDAYLELTDHFPDDYYSIEKLVQCYNAQGHFSQAEVMKRKLYEAEEKDLLYAISIADMFGMDHFTAGQKDVLGYERYEQPAGKAFIKYIFYVIDESGGIESTIFLEYTPSKTESNPGFYNPILNREGKRYKYNVAFEENIGYSSIRPYMMDIVSGKAEGTLIVD